MNGHNHLPMIPYETYLCDTNGTFHHIEPEEDYTVKRSLPAPFRWTLSLQTPQGLRPADPYSEGTTILTLVRYYCVLYMIEHGLGLDLPFGPFQDYGNALRCFGNSEGGSKHTAMARARWVLRPLPSSGKDAGNPHDALPIISPANLPSSAAETSASSSDTGDPNISSALGVCVPPCHATAQPMGISLHELYYQSLTTTLDLPLAVVGIAHGRELSAREAITHANSNRQQTAPDHVTLGY